MEKSCMCGVGETMVEFGTWKQQVEQELGGPVRRSGRAARPATSSLLWVPLVIVVAVSLHVAAALAAMGSDEGPVRRRRVAVVPTLPLGGDVHWPADASLQAMDRYSPGALSPDKGQQERMPLPSPLSHVVNAIVESGSFDAVYVAPLVPSSEWQGGTSLRVMAAAAAGAVGARLHVVSESVRRLAFDAQAAQVPSLHKHEAWMSGSVVGADGTASNSGVFGAPIVSGLGPDALVALATDLLSADPAADAVFVFNPACPLISAHTVGRAAVELPGRNEPATMVPVVVESRPLLRVDPSGNAQAANFDFDDRSAFGVPSVDDLLRHTTVAVGWTAAALELAADANDQFARIGLATVVGSLFPVNVPEREAMLLKDPTDWHVAAAVCGAPTHSASPNLSSHHRPVAPMAPTSSNDPKSSSLFVQSRFVDDMPVILQHGDVTTSSNISRTLGLPYGLGDVSNELVLSVLDRIGPVPQVELVNRQRFSSERRAPAVDYSEEHRSRSCAVVGNGGVLRGLGLGDEIDRHDIVFRFNAAPIASYEADVGAKTSFRAFYPESAQTLATELAWDPLDLQGRFLFVPFKPVDVEWLASIVDGNPLRTFVSGETMEVQLKGPHRRDGVSADQLTMLSPQFMHHVSAQWLNNSKPTLGLLGIMMSLQWCDVVDVYGFNIANKSAPYYYFSAEYSRDTYFAETDTVLKAGDEPLVHHKVHGEPHGHQWGIEQSIRWALGDLGVINDRTREAAHVL